MGREHRDGELTASHAKMELSGAASADLAGSVSGLEATTSGASRLSGPDLAIGELTIDLSGASQVAVTVTGCISAVVTGASSLRYAGTPTIERQDVSPGVRRSRRSVEPLRDERCVTLRTA